MAKAIKVTMVTEKDGKTETLVDHYLPRVAQSLADAKAEVFRRCGYNVISVTLS